MMLSMYPGLNIICCQLMKMTMSVCKVSFEGPTWVILRKRKRIAKGFLNSIHHYLNTAPSALKQFPDFVADLNLWHERLGHVHVDQSQIMARIQGVRGMNITTFDPVKSCEP